MRFLYIDSWVLNIAGGGCRLPDFAWQDWGIRQVERVWDLMDISLLRSAKIGVDPSYKTLVISFSLLRYTDTKLMQARVESLAKCRSFNRIEQDGHMSMSHTVYDSIYH